MPQITTQNVTGNVTLLYGAKGNETTPLLVVNLDQTNTVWVGNTSLVTASGSLGVPLQPQTSMSFDGSSTLYAVANAGVQLQVALIPGGTSYFLPASLSNLGGSKVFVQSGTPTGNIPLNSIWFNTASNSLETWDGTAWVNESFNAQNLIQAASILSAQIAAQGVRNINIANSSVDNTKISPNTILSSNIAPNTITAGNIANGTLTTTQIAAAAGILGTQIAAATITSGNIAANTIVAANIAANTITAAELAAGIIYAGIVNGTQIQGASFVADGTTGEVLVYSSSPPAHGNLIASVSPVAGTDGHSNNYVDTFAAYGPNGGTVQVAVNQTSGQPFIIFRPANGVSINSGVWPQVYGTVNNGGAANEYPTLWLIGGAEPNPGTGAQTYIQVTGEANDSSTVGVIQHFVDGHNIFGITTAYMQAYQPLLATDPSSGSFETWHSVTLPLGWAGTIRVKKLAEGNFACMDINCSFVDSSTGTSYNAGNLPSAAYYPTTRTQQPLTVNQGVGTSPTLPRVNIPTSGAIQIDMPGFAVNGQTCLVFGTIIYPLD